MALPRRTIFITLGSILALIVVAILAIPLFLNADSFRARIESNLTSALGRKVTLGKLDLSVFSGSLVAQNATVADDPAFSTQPFLQATSVKINIEVLPFVISRQIHIQGFALDAPHITLLRAANGTWNYSSIGGASSAQPAAAPDKDAGSMIPNLTVGHVKVTNGQLTVAAEAAPGAASIPKRTYDQLNLDVKDFSFGKSFPFTVSAHLPADGTVALDGTAGPVNQKDASLTPFTANLHAKHLDPLAAGFVTTADGITGLIDAIDVAATWNGQQLHVTNLLVDTPKLAIVRSNKPAAATPPPSPSSNDMFSTLVADHLQIKNGEVTLSTAGQQGKPAVYQQLNANITNVSPTTASPLTLTAQLPGGGSLNLSGGAGPLNQQNAAATPLNLHAVLNHIDLAASGVIAPDVGIGGLANLDVKAISNGQTLNANGIAHVEGLRLAKDGSPSAKPVDLQFTATQNMPAQTGQVQSATVTMGHAVINIAGTYQTSGPATAINLKVSGNSLSIDELQAFLPSLGVHLPTGSRLQGGTLTTSLNVTGSTAAPIISGPVRLDNTQLAGFDLGSKLSTLTALTGARTGSATQIRSLSMNITVNGGNIRTDNIALSVPALGTATGAGTVAASGALNYNVIVKLAALGGGGGSTGGSPTSAAGIAGLIGGLVPNGGGAAGSIGGLAGSALKNGVPVAIGGTTSNPTFAPNLGGLMRGGAGSAAQGLLGGGNKTSGKQQPANSLGNALGGLLNRHK